MMSLLFFPHSYYWWWPTDRVPDPTRRLVRQPPKPSFTPPSGIFAPVWTLLYIMIAVAGWRTFAHDPLGPAMIVWTIGLLLNFSWSPIFFGLHRPVAAFCVIVALLAMIITFIRLTWPQDVVAALLFVPYAAWTLFATLLNAAICRLNSSVKGH